MKKFSVSVLLVAFIFVGCSEDETSFQNDVKSTENDSHLQRVSSKSFTTLLANLYGSDYAFGSSYTVTDDVESFAVTEVELLSGAVGYAVEGTDSSYFIYDKNTGILDEYPHKDNGLVKISHDLTLDPDYGTPGFEVDTNQPLGKKRFWGWTKDEDLKWSDCLPDGTQIATRVHYVLWRENGSEVISRPCP